MKTEATVTRAPLHGGLEIDETSWIYGLGTTASRNATTALLIGISGALSYQHVLELCAYVRKYWKPQKEHLVLDFTSLQSADGEGVLYLISFLFNISMEDSGEIYLVRAPFDARLFLKRMWGSRKIHFAASIEEAISELR